MDEFGNSTLSAAASSTLMWIKVGFWSGHLEKSQSRSQAGKQSGTIGQAGPIDHDQCPSDLALPYLLKRNLERVMSVEDILMWGAVLCLAFIAGAAVYFELAAYRRIHHSSGDDLGRSPRSRQSK